jgi:hypothetical protein
MVRRIPILWTGINTRHSSSPCDSGVHQVRAVQARDQDEVGGSTS